MPEPSSGHPPLPFEMDTRSGLRLRGFRQGPDTGAPLVLLHGGGQTQRAWRTVADTVSAAGYLAVTVDQRGHGLSDWATDGAYRIDDFADDLRDLVTVLDEPPVVIGASLGGLAAIVAAGERPAAEVAALVLVDIAPRSSLEGRQHITNFMLAHQDGFASLEEAGAAVAGYLPHRPRRTSHEGLRHNLRTGPDGRLFWHWDPAFLGRTGISSAHDEDRLERAVAAVDRPILLIRGGDSDVLDESHALALLEHARDGEHVDVAGAGHMVAGDSNEPFGDAVMAFLRRRAVLRRP